MKTITIPADGRGDNPVTVIINGVKFSIARGTSVSVPDEVAAAVTDMLGLPLLKGDGYGPDDRILPVTSADAGKALMVDVNGEWTLGMPDSLPDVDSGDNGKVLSVVSGEWAAAAPAAGATIVTAQESSGDYAIQKKASELFALCQAGPVIITFTSGPYTGAVPIIGANKEDVGGGGYTFSFAFFDVFSDAIVYANASDPDDYPTTVTDGGT